MLVEPVVTNSLFIILMLWLLATPYVFLTYYHYAVRPNLGKDDEGGEIE